MGSKERVCQHSQSVEAGDMRARTLISSDRPRSGSARAACRYGILARLVRLGRGTPNQRVALLLIAPSPAFFLHRINDAATAV